MTGMGPEHKESSVSIQNLALNDKVRLLAAGGSIEIIGQDTAVNDLVRMAAAAKTGEATLTIKAVGGFALNDLVRIAAAGKGFVHLKD